MRRRTLPAAFLLFLLASGAAGEERIDRRREALDVPFSSAEGLFQHYCAHCHGEEGSGGGRLWATELEATPSDLTATTMDAPALRSFLEGGGKACPPWGRTIPPQDVERLADHVLALAGRTPPATTPPPPDGGQSFPWLLLLLLVVEIGALGALAFHQPGDGPNGPHNEGEEP